MVYTLVYYFLAKFLTDRAYGSALTTFVPWHALHELRKEKRQFHLGRDGSVHARARERTIYAVCIL